jgi:hypothetical protein
MSLVAINTVLNEANVIYVVNHIANGENTILTRISLMSLMNHAFSAAYGGDYTKTDQMNHILRCQHG